MADWEPFRAPNNKYYGRYKDGSISPLIGVRAGQGFMKNYTLKDFDAMGGGYTPDDDPSNALGYKLSDDLLNRIKTENNWNLENWSKNFDPNVTSPEAMRSTWDEVFYPGSQITSNQLTYSPSVGKDPFMLSYVAPALAGMAFGGPAISGLTSGLGLPQLPSLSSVLGDMLPQGVTDFFSSGLEGGAGGDLLGGDLGGGGVDMLDDLDWSGFGGDPMEGLNFGGAGAVPPVPGYNSIGGDIGGGVDIFGNPTGGGGVGTGGFKLPTSTDDMLKLLGRVAPGVIGALASGNQAEAIRELSKSQAAQNAPFREAALKFLNDPAALASGPGAANLDAVLRRLSATHGNPIDSPTALGIATDAGMRNWLGTVTALSGLGRSNTQNLDLAAIGSDANVLNALGDAAKSAFGGDQSLERALAEVLRRSTLEKGLTYAA